MDHQHDGDAQVQDRAPFGVAGDHHSAGPEVCEVPQGMCSPACCDQPACPLGGGFCGEHGQAGEGLDTEALEREEAAVAAQRGAVRSAAAAIPMITASTLKRSPRPAPTPPARLRVAALIELIAPPGLLLSASSRISILLVLFGREDQDEAGTPTTGLGMQASPMGPADLAGDRQP